MAQQIYFCRNGNLINKTLIQTIIFLRLDRFEYIQQCRKRHTVGKFNKLIFIYFKVFAKLVFSSKWVIYLDLLQIFVFIEKSCCDCIAIFKSIMSRKNKKCQFRGNPFYLQGLKIIALAHSISQSGIGWRKISGTFSNCCEVPNIKESFVAKKWNNNFPLFHMWENHILSNRKYLICTYLLLQNEGKVWQGKKLKFWTDKFF